jgi:SAM-dependent methyltransferase
MTMSVLQHREQIAEARAQLGRRGLSALDSRYQRMLFRLKLRSRPVIGDEIKSWDVLKSVDFIERNVPKSGAILDIGAYASEILSVLVRLGYQNLAGVDLNPLLKKSPRADLIRYEICNFMETPFRDGSFEAITSISVIEHGFQSERLLREISRLLKPGGFFISSFDYWPEKIDTRGQRFFGLDWLIFSAEDVTSFVSEARQFGLSAYGPLNLEAAERPIKFGDHQYTFGWLVLRKSG